jgi:Mu transposase-like protein
MSQDSATTLEAALQRFPTDERGHWIAEAKRLAHIVEAYGRLGRKRQPANNGQHAFVPEVLALCQQARCTDPIIIESEPHRGRAPSPHTLDRWHREYPRRGLTIFLRAPAAHPPVAEDRRCARMSPAAVDYINRNWRRYKSPHLLYLDLKTEAGKSGWTIPSESWLYRRWREMPAIVKTAHLYGQSAYESKYAPYVPRDHSGLAALQVLCGDHSERDVTVLTDKGELARPWLTVWQDLRTGLIWGWYLGLVPSSETASLAYADGLLHFGAQPFARPDEQFYSYVYTDQGRDYKSHRWDGQVIAVHKQVMRIDGELELLLMQQRIGILEELMIRHLLARGYNAKEKPVERFFRDLSSWEQNTFAEYCGSHPGERPDAWHKLYAQHQQYRGGKLSASPFMAFARYRDELAGAIARYNATSHERQTLGGARVVPLAEFRRLYTTVYQISTTAITCLLMKAEGRTIRKDGVQCFQRNWYYWHDRISAYKGAKVEVRFTDRDYGRVWVVLPDGDLCEARLITPTSLLNPNRETLKVVAQARAHERKLIRDFHLIAQSEVRGEGIEDRVQLQ